MTAVTWQCPLCPLTGLARGADAGDAAAAAADALEHHLTDHRQGKAE